jgi:hypothetical protein
MTAMFDLEQGILRCWNITDDIGEILDDLESGHMEMPEAAEALRAYQKVYQRRFERCFSQFEAYTAEVRDLRVQLKDLDHAKISEKKAAKRAKSKGQKEVDQ